MEWIVVRSFLNCIEYLLIRMCRKVNLCNLHLRLIPDYQMKRRMGNSGSLVFYIGLGIILVTILAGIYFFRFGHREMIYRDPDFTLTANQLYDEYAENEDEAIQKYRGKILEIQGVVSGTGFNPDSTSYILLQTNGSGDFILCKLGPAISGNPPKVNKGESVSIRGVNTGKLLSVIMEDCSLIIEP